MVSSVLSESSRQIVEIKDDGRAVARYLQTEDGNPSSNSDLLATFLRDDVAVGYETPAEQNRTGVLGSKGTTSSSSIPVRSSSHDQSVLSRYITAIDLLCAAVATFLLLRTILQPPSSSNLNPFVVAGSFVMMQNCAVWLAFHGGWEARGADVVCMWFVSAVFALCFSVFFCCYQQLPIFPGWIWGLWKSEESSSTQQLEFNKKANALLVRSALGAVASLCLFLAVWLWTPAFFMFSIAAVPILVLGWKFLGLGRDEQLSLNSSVLLSAMSLISGCFILMGCTILASGVVGRSGYPHGWHWKFFISSKYVEHHKLDPTWSFVVALPFLLFPVVLLSFSLVDVFASWTGGPTIGKKRRRTVVVLSADNGAEVEETWSEDVAPALVVPVVSCHESPPSPGGSKEKQNKKRTVVDRGTFLVKDESGGPPGTEDGDPPPQMASSSASASSTYSDASRARPERDEEFHSDVTASGDEPQVQKCDEDNYCSDVLADAGGPKLSECYDISTPVGGNSSCSEPDVAGGPQLQSCDESDPPSKQGNGFVLGEIVSSVHVFGCFTSSYNIAQCHEYDTTSCGCAVYV